MKSYIKLILIVLMVRSFAHAQLATYLPADVTVNMLEPEMGEMVYPWQFMIIISYYSPSPGLIDENRIRLFLDHEDITHLTTRSDRLLRFIPDSHFLQRPNLPGIHELMIRFTDQRGMIASERKMQVVILEPVKLPPDTPIKKVAKSSGSQRGHLSFVQTHNDYSLGAKDKFEGRVNYSIKKDEWFLKTSMYIPTDEDSKTQPRNSMSFDLHYGRGISVGLGDRYPSYHPFILGNQRVRGLETKIKLFNRGINTISIDVMYGLSQIGNENMGFSSKGNQSIGMYKRRLLAINPKLGGGHIFQLGFIFLKSKDDISSITLETDSLGQTSPKENVAMGSNLLISMFKRRVTLFGNIALGIYTNDIRSGGLSKETAKTLGAENVQKIFEKYSNILIINPSTSFLDTTFKTIENSMAYDAGLRVIVPKKTFKSYSEIKYKMIGPAYISFGREDLENSKRGLFITEQLLLLNRKLMLSGNLDLYSNNLDKAMPEATQFTKWNFSTRYNPGHQLPSLGFSLTNYDNVNKDTTDYALSSHNNTIGISSNYLLKTGTTLNKITLFFTNSILKNLGQKDRSNNNVGITVNSIYGNNPASTDFRFSTNGSKSIISTRYYSLDGGVRYKFIPQKLYGSLHMGTFLAKEQPGHLNTRLSLKYTIKSGMDLDLNGRLDSVQGTQKGTMVLRYNYYFLQ